jgi:hypothetical protein
MTHNSDHFLLNNEILLLPLEFNIDCQCIVKPVILQKFMTVNPCLKHKIRIIQNDNPQIKAIVLLVPRIPLDYKFIIKMDEAFDVRCQKNHIKIRDPNFVTKVLANLDNLRFGEMCRISLYGINPDDIPFFSIPQDCKKLDHWDSDNKLYVRGARETSHIAAMCNKEELKSFFYHIIKEYFNLLGKEDELYKNFPIAKELSILQKMCNPIYEYANMNIVEFNCLTDIKCPMLILPNIIIPFNGFMALTYRTKKIPDNSLYRNFFIYKNIPYYLNGRKWDMININTVLTRNSFLWFIVLNIQGSKILRVQPMVGSLEFIADFIRFNFSKNSDHIKIKDSKLLLVEEITFLLKNMYIVYIIKNVFYKKYIEITQALDVNIKFYLREFNNMIISSNIYSSFSMNLRYNKRKTNFINIILTFTKYFIKLKFIRYSKKTNKFQVIVSYIQNLIQNIYDILLFGIQKFIPEYVPSFKRIFHIQNIIPATILDRITIKTIYENGLNLELIFPITSNICYPMDNIIHFIYIHIVKKYENIHVFLSNVYEKIFKSKIYPKSGIILNKASTYFEYAQTLTNCLIKITTHRIHLIASIAFTIAYNILGSYHVLSSNTLKSNLLIPLGFVGVIGKLFGLINPGLIDIFDADIKWVIIFIIVGIIVNILWGRLHNKESSPKAEAKTKTSVPAPAPVATGATGSRGSGDSSSDSDDDKNIGNPPPLSEDQTQEPVSTSPTPSSSAGKGKGKNTGLTINPFSVNSRYNNAEKMVTPMIKAIYLKETEFKDSLEVVQVKATLIALGASQFNIETDIPLLLNSTILKISWLQSQYIIFESGSQILQESQILQDLQVIDVAAKTCLKLLGQDTCMASDIVFLARVLVEWPGYCREILNTLEYVTGKFLS